MRRRDADGRRNGVAERLYAALRRRDRVAGSAHLPGGFFGSTMLCVFGLKERSSSQMTAAVRISLGVFPVQRLYACVNALTSLKPSSHAILDTRSLRSSRYRTAKSRLSC
jgi:hypothetical protein